MHTVRKMEEKWGRGKGENRIAHAEARYWQAVLRSFEASMKAELREKMVLQLRISAKDAHIADLRTKLRLARRR